MKYIAILFFLPVFAYAHQGQHPHPHGIDTLFLLVIISMIFGYLIYRMKK